MRYSGKLGIAQQVEVSSGVWDEIITENEVLGEMVQRTETLLQGDNILPRVSTSTSVSVLLHGAMALDHSVIRYVTHAGKRWTIATAVAQPPRIVLYFGEEYHGPVPD